jgi:Stress responsive A/B Barrel Domain
MIRHIVMFRFKTETSEAEREAFHAMLRGLPGQIDEIAAFESGRDIVRRPRSFDLALVASYADLTALDRYTDHPAHLPVIERSRQICEQVVSVDYEY